MTARTASAAQASLSLGDVISILLEVGEAHFSEVVQAADRESGAGDQATGKEGGT